jgi:DNA-binding transcriptional regulator PaaX
VAVTAIAPNALKLINQAKWVHKTYNSLGSKKSDQRKKIIHTFYYLKRQGLISLENVEGEYFLKITKKGEEKVQKMNLRTLKIQTSKKWDGFWWVTIADIPTEMRAQAYAFRKKIKQLGLYTLQKSVWVYPFDPRDEITFIAALNGLDRYITIFKASEMEDEDEANLKSFFKFS